MKKLSYKPLSQITEEHACEIIKAGYPTFFGRGVRWTFSDFSESQFMPTKVLSSTSRHYKFWFTDLEIDIELIEEDSTLIKSSLYTAKLICYTKAYELGYYIKEINDLLVNLKTKK